MPEILPRRGVQLCRRFPVRQSTAERHLQAKDGRVRSIVGRWQAMVPRKRQRRDHRTWLKFLPWHLKKAGCSPGPKQAVRQDREVNCTTQQVRMMKPVSRTPTCARMRRVFLAWTAIIAGLVFSTTSIRAQDAAPAGGNPSGSPSAPSATGSIRGQVTDPTGAVIPNATVVVLTTAGQVAGKAASNAVGAYSIRGLAPGTYTLTAAANGFAVSSIPGVLVTAGQARLWADELRHPRPLHALRQF